MPKIPSAQSLEQVNPSGQAAVATQDTTLGQSYDKYGDAAAGLRDVGGVIEKKQALRDDYELSKAKSDYIIAQAQRQTEANDDQDHVNLAETFSKNFNEDYSKITASIGNPSIQNEFRVWGDAKTAVNMVGIETLARNREVEFESGSVEDHLITLHDIGIAGDAIEAFDSATDRIDSAVASGYITEANGAKRIAKFQEDVAIGKLKMLAPENRIEALAQPWAKALDPGRHAELLRQAEDAAFKKQAMDIVDGLEGLDRDDALVEIETINDKNLREKVEQRFDIEFNRNKQAETERVLDIYSEADLLVKKTGTVDSIDPQDWADMTPRMRHNLEALLSQANSPRKTSDPASVKRLQEIAATKNWDLYHEEFARVSNSLNPQDKEQYGKIDSDNMVPAGVEDQIYLQELMPRKGDKEKRNKVGNTLARWRVNYTNDRGKEPSYAERNAEADRLIMDYDKGFFSWSKDIHEYEDEERNQILSKVHFQEMQESDPAAYDQTMDYFKAHGIEPERYDFQDAMEMQGLLNREAIESPDTMQSALETFGDKTPTYEEIMDVYLRLRRIRGDDAP